MRVRGRPSETAEAFCLIKRGLSLKSPVLRADASVSGTNRPRGECNAYATLHYDSSGALLWEGRYDAVFRAGCVARIPHRSPLAVDRPGAVYVGGIAEQQDGPVQFLAFKYGGTTTIPGVIASLSARKLRFGRVRVGRTKAKAIVVRNGRPRGEAFRDWE